MRNLFKVLLVVLCISISGQVLAQMKFGLRAGINMSTYGGDAEDTKMKVGAQVGAVGNYGINEMISIQPGVIFTMKGSKSSEIDDFSSNENYLEIPINVVANFNGIQVFAGPYVAVGLFGKIKGGDDDITIKYKSDVSLDDFKEGESYTSLLDYGLNIGAGYMINETMQVQLGYGLGLANTLPKFDGEKPDDKVTNNVLQFTFTYFLGE